MIFLLQTTSNDALNRLQNAFNFAILQSIKDAIWSVVIGYVCTNFAIILNVLDTCLPTADKVFDTWLIADQKEINNK